LLFLLISLALGDEEEEHEVDYTQLKFVDVEGERWLRSVVSVSKRQRAFVVEEGLPSDFGVALLSLRQWLREGNSLNSFAAATLLLRECFANDARPLLKLQPSAQLPGPVNELLALLHCATPITPSRNALAQSALRSVWYNERQYFWLGESERPLERALLTELQRSAGASLQRKCAIVTVRVCGEHARRLISDDGSLLIPLPYSAQLVFRGSPPPPVFRETADDPDFAYMHTVKENGESKVKMTALRALSADPQHRITISPKRLTVFIS
jgi:hypothetical protein